MSADIDIDVVDRGAALCDLPGIAAMMLTKDGQRQRHPSGLYFQDIPVDPLDGMAVWGFREAAEQGYFKVDLLVNTVYQGVRDEAHLVDLVTTEPPWDRFDDPQVVAKLAHLGSHFDVVQSIRPQSVDDLAIILALIRPGKKHLIGAAREVIEREIWIKSDTGYQFKKAHAYSYALSIVVQLNLLVAADG